MIIDIVIVGTANFNRERIMSSTLDKLIMKGGQPRVIIVAIVGKILLESRPRSRNYSWGRFM